MNSIAGAKGYVSPVLVGGEAQYCLTQLSLNPYVDEISALFMEVRTLLDQELSRAHPAKNGAPYPKGRCLEITLAVKKWFDNSRVGNLSGFSVKARIGYEMVSRFIAEGGVFRQIWGDLRGEYFQNAFQLGSLYVDVSNDTVVVTKPKIEILPFERSGIMPVQDFSHFERIACSYWESKFYPNHLLPELAPYCPMIQVKTNGVVRFQTGIDYMIWLTLKNHFHPSYRYLASGTIPAQLFSELKRVLRKKRSKFASSPIVGRSRALAMCNSLRSKRRYLSDADTRNAISEIRLVNMKLRHFIWQGD